MAWPEAAGVGRARQTLPAQVGAGVLRGDASVLPVARGRAAPEYRVLPHGCRPRGSAKSAMAGVYVRRRGWERSKHRQATRRRADEGRHGRQSFPSKKEHAMARIRISSR